MLILSKRTGVGAVPNWSVSTQVATFEPISSAAAYNYGRAVAASGNGNVLVVGNVRDSGGGTEGSIDVWRRVNGVWSRETTIDAPGSVDDMGASVAINSNGDVIATGSPKHNDGSYTAAGCVYVWRYNYYNGLWELDATLLSANGRDDDFLGRSVDINDAGDVIVAGAPGDNTGAGTDAGSTYVFRYNSNTQLWTQEQKITPDRGSGYRVGTAVSIDGDVLVTTAPYADNGMGEVYVYRYNGTAWNQEQILQEANREATSYFGGTVSLRGNRFVCGVSLSASTPRATVFEYNGSVWNETAVITNSDPRIDGFGKMVSLTNDLIVVTDPLIDDNVNGVVVAGAGFVYRYSNGNWVLVTELNVTGTRDDYEKMGDLLGAAISGDGRVIILGVPQYDPAGGATHIGLARVFTPTI